MPHLVIQCSASKVTGPVAAAMKYDNRAHRAALDFMLDGGFQAGWDLTVLSAEHGLVPCTTALDDYDVALTHERQIPALVAKSATAAAEIDADDDVFFYGSKLYLKALSAMLPGRDIEHVGAGARGCGDYFSALKGLVASYDADA